MGSRYFVWLPVLAFGLIGFVQAAAFAKAPMPQVKQGEPATDETKPADTHKKQVETEEQRDARMEWWREGKFGMFVHWGCLLYTSPSPRDRG